MGEDAKGLALTAVYPHFWLPEVGLTPTSGLNPTLTPVVITMLANVKQKAGAPFIKETIAPGTRVYTDEYSIDARLRI